MAKLCTALLLLALAPADGKRESFDVDGQQRQARVFANPRQAAAPEAPLIFVFHGRGGRAERAAERINLHRHWPEAVVVYMQGLPSAPGANDPTGKRSGWQMSPGDQGDRDVRFFDVALDHLQKEYKIDLNRVYLLGHSNGGRFANVLWNMRGEKLAALCSASAQGGRLIRNCKPKSIFMIMGEKDTIVPYNWQRQSIGLCRQVLQTDRSNAKTEGLTRTEPGKNNTELVIYIHSGGHEFPAEATPLVIKFFKRHSRE